jgi:hypothetical protein
MRRALALVALAWVVCPTSGRAEEARLFVSLSGAAEDLAPDALGVTRARPVALNSGALPGADGVSPLPRPGHVLVLNLFDDVELRARLVRAERLARGMSWVGKLEGESLGDVVLTVHDGILSGSVTWPEASYRIAVEGGRTIVQQLDHSQFPEDGCFKEVPGGGLEPAPDATAQTDDGSTIDVLVVYTPAARAAAGSTSAIEATIATAISETNAGYANSGVVQRLQLAAAVEVSYTESGDIGTDLDRITDVDGILDNVHTLRDTYKADLVSLITETPGSPYCGIAWLMAGSSPGFATHAFSVVERGCATGYYSFGHELGHNMGLNHARSDATGTGAFSYSYGHKWTGYRTVMAYAPGTRLLYFSNPGVSYAGNPTGIVETSPTSAHNALSLNNTRVTVANWRSSGPQVTVTSPNGGESWDVGSAHTISWTASGLAADATLRLTYTDGVTTHAIATGLARTVTSYGWTVPNNPGSSWRVTVCSEVPPGTCEASDSSDGTLTIPVPQPPTIHSFTASPTTLRAGGTTTLSWSVAGATTLAVNGSAVYGSTGSTTRSVSATTTFSLTATNAHGSTTSTVTVSALPAITSFEASPTELRAGGSTVISWSVMGSTSITLNGLPVSAPTGSTTRAINVTSAFTLVATNAHGSDTATLTVTALPGLSVSDVSVFEGSAGTTLATFAVRFSPAASAAGSVDYTTLDGTALGGEDYQSLSGTLTFAPGDTVKTVVIPVVGDTNAEDNESFVLWLSNPSRALIDDPAGHAVIRDDDKPGAELRPQAIWHAWFAVDTLETPYVGDFNGDGKTDIITFTRQNPSAVGDVYVALSDGRKFGSNAKWNDWFAITTDETVVIGDYDGDGKDDIATWLGKSTRQVYVALSTGSGMAPASVWLSSIGADPSDVPLAGDANGDGRKDLILFARKQGKVYVALSDGSRFAAPTVWHGFFAVSTYERPRVADVDGDGKADIVTFATDSPTAFGDVYVSLSDGTRFVDKNGAPNSSDKWHDWFAIRPTEQVRVGDLDADGREDFYTFLPPPFAQCYTVLSRGTSMADNALWPESVGPDARDVPYVGDADGDGRADVIVFAQGEGKVYVSLAQQEPVSDYE